jgi:prevent-host-death family protein
MRTVNIGDLKARLSAHIRFVREGEEVLVCDRNKPVARLVPCHLEERSAQERRLAARGVLTPPLKKRPASGSWPNPPGNVSDEAIEQALRQERESR